MPKPNPLQSALSQKPAPVQAAVPVVAVASRSRAKSESASPSRAPSRVGRVLIGAHFAPEVQTAPKVIAAEERTTIQELLSEAIDTVLAKRGKPQIASLTPSQD